MRCESLTELTEKQLTKTFRTNIFSFFFMAKHALKHMKNGASIINTASITAYRGHKTLLELFGDQGRNRNLHPITVGVAGQEGHSRQRGGAGTNLDAAQSGIVQAKESGEACP